MLNGTQDSRTGAARDDAAARPRIRRRGRRARSPTARDTTLVLDLSGHPDWANRVAQHFRAGARAGAHATAHATWISPSCIGCDVAAAGPAVLPVAVRTPRRCPCRGSSAPPPRRRCARSSRANVRMRSARRRREPARTARMQRNEIHERAALPRELARAESRAPRRRSRRRA